MYPLLVATWAALASSCKRVRVAPVGGAGVSDLMGLGRSSWACRFKLSRGHSGAHDPVSGHLDREDFW